MSKGYVQSLVEAGATFVTPGCAACLGTHEGMIASGETCITTTNRNFPGRMGHTEARILFRLTCGSCSSRTGRKNC